jgi:flagellar assembly protein FliH
MNTQPRQTAAFRADPATRPDIGFSPAPDDRQGFRVLGLADIAPRAAPAAPQAAPDMAPVAELAPEPLPPAPAPPQPARPAAAAPAVPAVTPAALAEAHARGRAEALAEAQAGLQAERDQLAMATAAMAGALARLTTPPPAEVDALASSIRAAVLRLASDRAGLAIDTAPDAFAARVLRLAERAAQGMAEARIHLHPDDLAAIMPLLGTSSPAALAPLAEARLLADPALQRGDADIRLPGLRIADLLADDTAVAS